MSLVHLRVHSSVSSVVMDLFSTQITLLRSPGLRDADQTKPSLNQTYLSYLHQSIVRGKVKPNSHGAFLPTSLTCLPVVGALVHQTC